MCLRVAAAWEAWVVWTSKFSRAALKENERSGSDAGLSAFFLHLIAVALLNLPQAAILIRQYGFQPELVSALRELGVAALAMGIADHTAHVRGIVVAKCLYLIACVRHGVELAIPRSSLLT